MSMTPDASNYFAPLNYTTSFTNPAAYNNASLQNVFGQGQQTINDLYRSGGGFGTLTNYYSGLGAHYAAAGMSPFGVFSEGGGGGASPYQTSANVWDTGAAPFQGGGGSSGMGGSIFDGGFGGGIGSLGASPYQTTPNVFDTGARGLSYPGAGSIDWGGLSKIAQNLPQSSAANFGTGMFGGLGGAGATPGAGQLDWTKLYPSGGAKTDPYPNMAQPGGLNQPMVTPQQQPQDFGSLFGRSVGGTAGAPVTPQPAAPSFDVAGKTAQPSLTDYGATPSLDFSKLFGGDKATAAPATPQPIPQTAPQAGGEAAGASFNERFGAAPASTAPPPSPETGALPSGALGANATPEQIIQQSRDKLAKLMGPYDQPSLEEFRKGTPAAAAPAPLSEARPTETPNPLEAIKETLDIPLPRARPAAADVPRPPGEIFPARRLAPNGQEPEAFIVHHTEGNPTLKSVTDYWRGGAEGRGRGLGTQYFMDRDGVVHDVAAETGYTGTSQTYPANQPGTEGLQNRNLVGMEISAKNDQDVTPAQIESLKRFMAARYPDTPAYGHKEIEGGKGEAEGFKGARAILEDRPPLFNFDWSKAPIPDPAQTVVDPITGRMGPNPNLRAGVPVSQFMDKLGPSTPAGQPEPQGTPYWKIPDEGTPEWNQQVYEGRKGLGGISPRGPEVVGGAGAYENFPRSENVIDRRTEQLGRDEIARLKAIGTGIFAPMPDTAPVTPLGADAGLAGLRNTPLGHGLGRGGWAQPPGLTDEEGDVPTGAGPVGPRSSAFGFDPSGYGEGGYGNVFTPQGATSEIGGGQTGAGGSDYFNPLVAQRSGYADLIRNDPDKSLQLAARLYSEDQNNPATRQAILEAMMNRLAATGQDPLNPGYYPKDMTAYNSALEKVSSDNALLNQIYQEMEGPFGGSNTANFATDWASAGTAAEERKYTTPTWTSPSNEQFFLKDLNNPFTGPGIAAKNRAWYESVTSPFPR